jgi:hypothetical protein
MKNLILVALTIVLSNVPAMAKDLKVCGVRSSRAAERELDAQAAIYCGNKKKVPNAESIVFPDKPKYVWATDQFGRPMGVVPVSCYKQSFGCVTPAKD